MTDRTAGLLRLGGLLRPVLDYALPPRCPGCGAIVADAHAFCLGCWHRLDFLGGPACACCGDPFETPVPPGTACDACRAAPPPFADVAAAVAYGPVARRLALTLKHGGRIGLAETMARLMARRLPEDARDMLFVPVPLHRWRLWRRGFNQAALVARALARRTGARADPTLLLRTRRTPLLRGLGREARAAAVRGAFAVSPAGMERITGERILLVDDVYTTGATAGACAHALKAAGAAEVRLICWARVVRPGDGHER